MDQACNAIRSEFVRITDDFTIHVEESGNGDMPIVFIPGWTMSTKVFGRQLAHFRESNRWRAISYDPRGQGLTTKTIEGHSYQQHGRDLGAFIAVLGLKRVVLIGHSIGGPVVLEAARRMPGRVAGLVLVDSWVDFEQRRLPAEEVEKYLAALQADYRATLTAIVSQYLFSASTPEPVKARVLETVLSGPQEIGVAVARSSMAYDPLPALR